MKKKKIWTSRRILRIGLILIVVAIFIITAALVIYYKTEAYTIRLAYEVRKYLEKRVERQVELEKVSFSLIPFGVVVDNLVIYGPNKEKEVPFCELKKVSVGIDILKIFKKQFLVKSLKLEDADINVIYYKDGSTNFLSFKKDKEEGGKSNIDFGVSKVIISSMRVMFKHEDIPLIFETKDLNALFVYDKEVHGYRARLRFFNATLQIKEFDKWHFNSDMKFIARGKGLDFDYIFFYSKGIKMVNVGTMVNYKRRIFDLRVFVDYSCDEVREWFRIPTELKGRGYFIGSYKGSFSKFDIGGKFYLSNFQIYKLRYDVLSGDFWMNDNELLIKRMYGIIGEGDFEGGFNIKPLHGRSQYISWAKFSRSRLEKFAEWFNFLPVMPSGEANFKGNLSWYEDSFRKFYGKFSLDFSSSDVVDANYYKLLKKAKEPVIFPVNGYTRGNLINYEIRDFDASIKTVFSKYDLKGRIGFRGDLSLQTVADTKYLPEVDVLYHLIEGLIRDKEFNSEDLWEVYGGTNFVGRVFSTFSDIKFEGRFKGSDVIFRSVLWGDCTGYVKYNNRIFYITDIDVKKGEKSFYADHAVFNLGKEGFFEDGDVSAKVILKKYSLVDIMKAIKIDIDADGSVIGKVEINGATDNISILTDIKVINADIYKFPIDSVEFIMEYKNKAIEVSSLKVFSQGAFIQGGGGIEIKDYRFKDVLLNIRGVPLKIIGEKYGVPVLGQIDGMIKVNGSIQKPEGVLDIKAKGFEVFDLLIDNVECKAEADGSKIVSTFRSRNLSGNNDSIASIEFIIDLLNGYKYLAEVSMRRYLAKIPMSGLSSQAGYLEGLMTAEIRSEGSLYELWQGNSVFEVSNLLYEVPEFSISTSKSMNVVIQNSMLEINEGSFLFDKRQFALKLLADLKKRLVKYIYVNGNLNLKIARNLIEDLIMDGDGEVEIEGREKSGTLQYHGVVNIKGANLKYKSFPLALTSANGVIAFQEGEILLKGLKGRSGIGEILINGIFKLNGYQVKNFSLRGKGTGVKFNYPEELISYGDFDLNWFGSIESSVIIGNIDIKEASWNKDYSLPSLLKKEEVIGEERKEADWLNNIKLNLHVIAPQRVYLRANIGNLRVFLDEKVDLKIINTLKNPVLLGRAATTAGNIIFLGNEFRVSSGIIDFINPLETTIQVSFNADTYIREYLIKLYLSGSIENFNFQFNSEPPLSQSDIWALISGSSIEPGQRTPLTSYAQDSAIAALGSSYLVSPVLSAVQEETKSILGLSNLEISPTNISAETNPSAKVTINKYITKDLSITYSTDLSSSKEQIVLIEYQIVPGVVAVASRNEKGYYGVDFRINKIF